MKASKFFVLGGLACVLVLLELPPLNGRYLLVELEESAEMENTAAAAARIPDPTMLQPDFPPGFPGGPGNYLLHDKHLKLNFILK